MRFRNLLLLLLLLAAVCIGAAAQAKLANIPALSDASVQAAIRAALDASGFRLVRPDGSVLCQIWLRKSLPVGRIAAAKGAAYPEMSESALLGVISFPNGGKDFRGQAIKPGFYTMRYELLPEDGNHLGVAPTRDFVLLVAASADNDPDAQYDYAQLVKLSVQAAGTNHPAAFVLLAPENGATRLREPGPAMGSTVTVSVEVLFPPVTFAVPLPCRMKMPAELSPSTATAHCPDASDGTVTELPVVVVENVAPLGPLPEMSYKAVCISKSGASVRAADPSMTIVRPGSDPVGRLHTETRERECAKKQEPAKAE